MSINTTRFHINGACRETYSNPKSLKAQYLNQEWSKKRNSRGAMDERAISTDRRLQPDYSDPIGANAS
ncbi:Protein CBG22671, partial [Caenorhabditis briggsae]